ncbi:MAG TPA: hypothetical protein VF690_13000 [Hymenobacter sp.]|jgi:hypothetical protein
MVFITPPPGKTLCIDVVDCARCGHDHEAVPVRPLTKVVCHGDQVIATHFATCPGTGEPLLVHLTSNLF